MTNFGFQAAKQAQRQQDTGWRIFPTDTFSSVVYTGQTVTSIQISIVQRRIGALVFTGFTFMTDDPVRTATAGSYQAYPTPQPDYMWPKSKPDWWYGGNSPILTQMPVSSTNGSGTTLLQTRKASNGGANIPYLNISFNMFASYSELVTNTTYFVPGSVPIVCDDPFPTVLPGSPYTP